MFWNIYLHGAGRCWVVRNYLFQPMRVQFGWKLTNSRPGKSQLRHFSVGLKSRSLVPTLPFPPTSGPGLGNIIIILPTTTAAIIIVWLHFKWLLFEELIIHPHLIFEDHIMYTIVDCTSERKHFHLPSLVLCPAICQLSDGLPFVWLTNENQEFSFNDQSDGGKQYFVRWKLLCHGCARGCR